jgi:hypothetical protein
VRGRAARDGVVREPAQSGAPDKAAPLSPAAAASFSATVDVYFHVVTDGTTGAVTDADVARQIDVMNMGFGGLEGVSSTAAVTTGGTTWTTPRR